MHILPHVYPGDPHALPVCKHCKRMAGAGECATRIIMLMVYAYASVGAITGFVLGFCFGRLR